MDSPHESNQTNTQTHEFPRSQPDARRSQARPPRPCPPPHARRPALSTCTCGAASAERQDVRSGRQVPASATDRRQPRTSICNVTVVCTQNCVLIEYEYSMNIVFSKPSGICGILYSACKVVAGQVVVHVGRRHASNTYLLVKTQQHTLPTAPLRTVSTYLTLALTTAAAASARQRPSLT